MNDLDLEVQGCFPYTAVATQMLLLAIAAVLVGCTTPEPTAGGATLTIAGAATSDSTDVQFPFRAASGIDGRVYVSTHAISRLVMVLDSSGNLLHTLGTHGPGPGEFGLPTFILPKDDSVVVADVGGDLTLFDGAGRYVRTLSAKVTGNVQALLLRGDTLLVAAPINTQDRFGSPLHIVGPSGEFVRSFGSDDRSIDPSFRKAQLRVIAPETDSTFWVARLDRYVLERWHSSGKRLRVLDQRREWYEPMTRDHRAYAIDRPASVVMSLYCDTNRGYLFTLVQRARSDWSPERISRVESGEESPLTDWLQYVEQLVEVIDVRSGALVASVVNESDSYLLNFLGDGRVFSTQTAPDGRQMPVFWRVLLSP